MRVSTLVCGAIVEIPGVADHQLKVVIVVNGGRDVVVVLNKLGESKSAVAGVTVLQGLA